MNLAGVLPWNIVRALGVLALLFVGNLFCMACPFTLPRELGRRFGWARFRWPQWLRVKWIGVGLMVVFFFGYERFALWNSPARTAWLLIAYVGHGVSGGHFLSRRQLLQIRLPDRPVQLRGIVDLSDDTEDSQRIDLQHVRDA